MRSCSARAVAILYHVACCGFRWGPLCASKSSSATIWPPNWRRYATRLDLNFGRQSTDATATGFDKITRPDRLALLLGSEGHGLAADWVARCDRAVTIPMAPQVDSFNVAVAAGILLYHLTR